MTEYSILSRSRKLARQAVERPACAPVALEWLARARVWAERQRKTRTAAIVECRRAVAFLLVGARL